MNQSHVTFQCHIETKVTAADKHYVITATISVTIDGTWNSSNSDQTLYLRAIKSLNLSSFFVPQQIIYTGDNSITE